MQINRDVPIVPIAAGMAAGLAAWFTAGSLDLLAGRGGPVRVAMLPSLAKLAALVAGGALGGWLLRELLFRVGSRDRAARLVEALLPLFFLPVLALPFLPILPDRLRVLIPLAGPGRYIVWFVALSLVAWAAADNLASQRTAMPSVPKSVPPDPARRRSWLIFAAGALVFSAAGLHLTRSPVYPGGDEPHYLVMAQSLWRDGDLAIENNHQRLDYAEYFTRDLKPDYLTRGVDRQIYSVHPVGLSVLLAPVYALAGYRGVTVFLALVAAAAATLAWRHATTVATPAAATFAWLAAALSAPYLLNSFAVYPEIVAGLCVVTVVATGTAFHANRPRAGLVHGLAIAALPWLSTKYAPMSAVLATISLARIWSSGAEQSLLQTLRHLLDPARRRAVTPRVRATFLLLAPYGLSLAGWFFFFHSYWGTFSPTAPYGTYHQTSVLHLRTGLLGLLFDQEYGMTPYAPILLVAFTGLWHMWRAGSGERRTALEIVLALGALIGTAGAFRIWWGGSAAPGRPMASGLLLLAIPLAWQYARASHSPPTRAAYRLLLAVGLSLAGILVFAQEGLLIANERDGSSRLLEWLSPGWRLWALFPSFIAHYPWTAAAFVCLWLATAWATLAGVRRIGSNRDTRSSGRAALHVALASSAGVVVASIAVHGLLGRSMQPDVRLEARSRLAILDNYDATRRPMAAIYDPSRRVPPTEVLPLAQLVASPDSRAKPQPVPLLFNGRFSLPAGECIVELERLATATTTTGTLGLQLGRKGAPAREWRVEFDEHGRWRAHFALQVDVGFVGFRASRAPRFGSGSPAGAPHPGRRCARTRQCTAGPGDVLLRADRRVLPRRRALAGAGGLLDRWPDEGDRDACTT